MVFFFFFFFPPPPFLFFFSLEDYSFSFIKKSLSIFFSLFLVGFLKSSFPQFLPLPFPPSNYNNQILHTTHTTHIHKWVYFFCLYTYIYITLFFIYSHFQTKKTPIRFRFLKKKKKKRLCVMFPFFFFFIS